MNEPIVPGARQRAHAEVRTAILAAASARVAADGATALSLRAVARDLGMVSSAVYRYFASRDELLTALIVQAYDSLGAAAEASVDATVGEAPAERWVDAALAIRAWAWARPHDYALLYGTPVPGYAAPDDTTVPGTRVSRALIRIVADALRDGRIIEPPDGSVTVSAGTADSFRVLREIIELGDASDGTALMLVLAWTQLFGLLSFELFGQTRNFVHDDELLFHDAAATMARHLGLAGVHDVPGTS
jgi:AcrR family transcriptional regulator